MLCGLTGIGFAAVAASPAFAERPLDIQRIVIEEALNIQL
jgi:hypothetical protein